MYLLVFIASFACFVESIFGFAGTVLFTAISGFFFDIKTVSYAAIYVSSIASLAILVTAYKDLRLHHILKVAALSVPGVIIGALLVDWVMTPDLLMSVFAFFLILYGCQALFLPQFRPAKLFRYSFVAAGGVIQGLFSTGGPFVLMGYKDDFDNKSVLRACMAVFFLSGNILRLGLNAYTPERAAWNFIADYYWVAIPIALAVFLGHRVHLKLPEELFKKILIMLLTGAGIIMLINSL